MPVHQDFAKLAQRDRALEPFGVGHQANLYKNAFQLHQVLLTGRAVLVFQAVYPAIGAGDLGGLRIGVNGDVG